MFNKKYSRILVTRTDRVGDVVMMTPLLRALRGKFPDAHIAALVHPRARDVLLHNPRIDELLVDEPEGEHAGRAGFWKQVRELRKKKFDTALLLFPTERLAWMLFAAGIPRRYGVGVKLYGVLTGMRSVRREYMPLRHEADYAFDFGRKLGVTSSDISPEVFVSGQEDTEARLRLEQAGINLSVPTQRVVGIHPWSGGSAPNWNVERYVQLCEMLIQDSRIRVVILGGLGMEQSAKEFTQLPKHKVAVLSALSLRQLAAVVARLHVLISSSTGPMHIAAALRVPTVSLFCPEPNSSATHWGPLGNDATIVLPPNGFCGVRCSGNPHTCEFEGGIQSSEVVVAVLRVVGLAGDGVLKTRG